MPGQLRLIRQPKFKYAMGMELECLVRNTIVALDHDKFLKFWYVAYDGSIRRNGTGEMGVEFVSQPMTPKWLCKQIDILNKTINGWTFNYSCGIHIHVSRQWLNKEKAEKMQRALKTLFSYQYQELFGRPPNDYQSPLALTGSRYNSINTTNKNTVEFRMWAAGDATWAKECVRRTVLMCNHKGDFSYRELMDLFTRDENAYID